MFNINLTIESTYKGSTHTVADGMQFAINDFLGRLQDKHLLFEQVAHEVLEPATMEQFETEGAAGGTPWQRLEPTTNKLRIRKGFPPAHPILEQTGDLKDSFRTTGANHIEEFGPDSGEWGSASHAFHQEAHRNLLFGSGHETINPARPILYWNEILQAKAEAVLSNWGVDAARGIFETEPTALLPTWE